jgi:hypothetical protein
LNPAPGPAKYKHTGKPATMQAPLNLRVWFNYSEDLGADKVPCRI